MRIKCLFVGFAVTLFCGVLSTHAQLTHPRLIADAAEIETARVWVRQYAWYRGIVEAHQRDVDQFIQHGPIYVSPVKQTYTYKMYSCPKHDVELLYEEYRPFDHRCRIDTTEVYRGNKYDAAWAGWYNRVLAGRLVWMGILYNLNGDERYAAAGKDILMKFADLYLKYPTANTILGPAHVFFGTLSESFWGVDMAYGYDLLYSYKGFSEDDRQKLKEKLFYPLALITQQFPESASNRQQWYNNVSAAVGFLYGDTSLVNFALNGQYGFYWQLGSALPESGLWPEWSGYHYVTLRGMIHLAEMARHNGLDLYHKVIAGRSIKKMFDAPFEIILPNYEFPRSKDSGGGSLLEYSTFYEVGYAVYHDPKYAALLNRTSVMRGQQVVGETSALGEANAPITMFDLVPSLPKVTDEFYPDSSTHLEGNGFAALRNGSGKDRRYLYLDYGIMGGEHGHPDRMQIGYYANGRNWLVDPLNESYFDPMLQLWFRQTIAHNTLVIDQTSQTWTNGEERFFGALSGLQVASGKTETAYPGVNITRTLIQVGDYFIDLADVRAKEPRIIDWPLHSFGSLTVKGVDLQPEPRDLFGHEPGIPGYDQLKDIRSAETDSGWSGVFEDAGGHFAAFGIGQKGTEVFQCISPRIGGFYKQMVKEPMPMPMLMSRRIAASTRFATLMSAYETDPAVLGFSAVDSTQYRVARNQGEDLVYADVPNSSYWILSVEGGKPARFSGLNVRRAAWKGLPIVVGDAGLSGFECSWGSEELRATLPERFGHVRIWAPGIRRVMVAGVSIPFVRDGDYLTIRSLRPVFEIISPTDSTLFLGRKNVMKFTVWNPTDHPVKGKVTLSLQPDWRERVTSQLGWWGGVVNLKATNKGPVERTTVPIHYDPAGAWIDGVASGERTIEGGGFAEFQIPIDVPNDAPPVAFPVQVQVGEDKQSISMSVRPPIRAEIKLPNARKNTLQIHIDNSSSENERVSLNLRDEEKVWNVGSFTKAVTLGPRESKIVTVPISFKGYKPDEQLYPIRLMVESGSFRTEVVRDIRVGIAHPASSTVSLDGSWKGWNTKEPMTIDLPKQVCRLLLGNQPWGGKSDLSARIYAMYDAKYLYVGADVADQKVVTFWDFPAMSYPWDTDCMEVVLDTRTNSGQWTDPPTPGLYRHLSMAEYRHTDFGPELWRGGGAGGPLLPKPLLVPGAETYFHRTADGYSLICRYPLSELGSAVAKPGYKIGFDVGISDNDGTTYRKNLHIWSGFTQNQSWWDMGTIGVLIFGK